MSQPNLLAYLRVFLCCAEEDKARVAELGDRLRQSGVKLYFDTDDLLPGQNISQELATQIRNSHVVIICLSQRAILTEGELQRNLHQALGEAEKKPTGQIYIIPLLLERCALPYSLEKYVAFNYVASQNYEPLLQALIARARALIPVLKLDPTQLGQPAYGLDGVGLRAYIENLDHLRWAATQKPDFEEKLKALPELWKYTLLHGTLVSRINAYPNELFEVLWRAGHEDEVGALLQLLPDSTRKDQLLNRLNHQRVVKKFSSEKAPVPVDTAQSQAEAAMAELEAGHSTRAYDYLLKALKLVYAGDSKAFEPGAWSGLAIGLLQAGEQKQAEELFTSAIKLARAIEIPQQKGRALLDVAVNMAYAGRSHEHSGQWIREAFDQVGDITGRQEKISFLQALIAAATQTNHWKLAEDAAYKLGAPELKSWELKNKALHEIAAARTQAWNNSQTPKELTRLEETLLRLKDRNHRAEALRLVVELTKSPAKLEATWRLKIIQDAWLKAETRPEAFQLLPIVNLLLPTYPELASSLRQAAHKISQNTGTSGE